MYMRMSLSQSLMHRTKGLPIKVQQNWPKVSGAKTNAEAKGEIPERSRMIWREG
jgi:hypothetical protein